MNSHAHAAEIDEALRTGRLHGAAFGMGCFWGPDSRLGELEGVVQTRVGYAGGIESEPTYRDIRGHAEVVHIAFDPAVLTFDALFGQFRHWFKPAKVGRADRWSQYRPVVLTSTDAQREMVERFLERFDDLERPQVGSMLEQDGRFWSAEDYHQKYRLRTLSPPLASALSVEFGARWDESTLATKCNALEKRLLSSGQFEPQLRQLSERARAAYRAALE